MLAVIFVTAAGNAGCMVHEHPGYGYPGPPPVVFTEPPTLVEVGPGVWVVRDYDYPVYYVDDYYWAYRDRVWYGAPSYERGWRRVREVPTVIVRRHHRADVHFHGSPVARTRVAPAAPMRPASLYPAPERVVPRRPAEARPRAREQRERATQRVKIERRERATRPRAPRLDTRERVQSRDRAAQERISEQQRRGRAEERLRIEKHRVEPVRRGH